MGKKKDEAYEAYQRLMSDPGQHSDMWDDVNINIVRRTRPHGELVAALLRSPMYDDRATALVYGSMIEQALEWSIADFFAVREDDSRRVFSYPDDGPLSDFSAKILMGFVLGIYDERMRHDLTWVRQVRNVFAHARLKVDFSHPDVQLMLKQIFLYRDAKLGTDPAVDTPRNRFVFAVACIRSYLKPQGIAAVPLRFSESDTYRKLYPPEPSPETLG